LVGAHTAIIVYRAVRECDGVAEDSTTAGPKPIGCIAGYRAVGEREMGD